MSRQDQFDVVVVGGGVAAGACVTTLREQNFDGSIAVVCAEPHAPYTRPGLTKQVLRGEKPEPAALWRPAEWYAENTVDLQIHAAATDLDTRAKRVRVAGRSLGYGSLVLATGAEPRSLPFDAAIADRVHVLRSFADAQRIRPHLGEGNRWLVIGGGFIGSEFAASARLTGSDVTLVMLEECILQLPFGDVAAGWFDDRLRQRGVAIHPETGIDEIRPDGDALAVRLKDGTDIIVDHICIGIGVVPNIGLAQQAGLTLEGGGIAADRALLTSAPDVYAAGDVCAYDSVLHGHRVRIEHWDVARAHGAHIAGQIASGERQDFREVPYFFGTMGDWAFLEYVGTGIGTAIPRGPLDGDDLSIVYLDDDSRLVGVLTVGRSDDLEAGRRLVPRGVIVDRTTVSDPATPIESSVHGEDVTA